jgi:hypothetical protein
MTLTPEIIQGIMVLVSLIAGWFAHRHMNPTPPPPAPSPVPVPAPSPAPTTHPLLAAILAASKLPPELKALLASILDKLPPGPLSKPAP